MNGARGKSIQIHLLALLLIYYFLSLFSYFSQVIFRRLLFSLSVSRSRIPYYRLSDGGRGGGVTRRMRCDDPTSCYGYYQYIDILWNHSNNSPDSYLLPNMVAIFVKVSNISDLPLHMERFHHCSRIEIIVKTLKFFSNSGTAQAVLLCRWITLCINYFVFNSVEASS